MIDLTLIGLTFFRKLIDNNYLLCFVRTKNIKKYIQVAMSMHHTAPIFMLEHQKDLSQDLTVRELGQNAKSS